MRKAIAHLKSADPVLAGIIEKVGRYRMQYTEPTFHSLVRSIVYQQLSGKAAATIFGRVKEAAGDPVTPDALLSVGKEQLRALGLSQQKASYVLDLAARTAAAEIEFAKLGRLRDAFVIDKLTKVKGVGVWTVHMFLMFALRRPNVLPTGDLGIRSAIKRAYNLAELPTAREVEDLAQAWHPYCSIASWYLWRSLEIKESDYDQ